MLFIMWPDSYLIMTDHDLVMTDHDGPGGHLTQRKKTDRFTMYTTGATALSDNDDFMDQIDSFGRLSYRCEEMVVQLTLGEKKGNISWKTDSGKERSHIDSGSPIIRVNRCLLLKGKEPLKGPLSY